MMENKSPFAIAVNRASQQIKKLDATLAVTQFLIQSGDMEGAYSSAFDYALQAEKLTLTARSLPAYSGKPGAKHTMEQQIRSVVPVKVGYTMEGWFALSIPVLLPHKERGNANYIRTSLYLALDEFFRSNPPVHVEDCVLILRHCYDRLRPERAYRDHDNIEVNAVVDAIALYALSDDAPLRCAHYYCTAVSDADETQVFIVPVRAFPKWLAHAANGAYAMLELHIDE